MACTGAPERREAKETRRKDHELDHYSTISHGVPTAIAPALTFSRNRWVDFRMSPLEIQVRQDRRSAAPRPGEEDHVEIMYRNESIQVSVDQAQCEAHEPSSLENQAS